MDFETSTKAIGGSIRAPRSVPVTIDKRKAQFTKALYNMPDEPANSFSDVEARMYSHYGGQISGKGARFDPPHVRKFVHHTLKQYPKLLHAYNAGRVVNPPGFQVPFRADSRGPDIIDYGGSLPQISHSENGRLVHFDAQQTAHKNFVVRYR